MDYYKLTVYASCCSDASNHTELTWIELIDIRNRSSHIFNFISGSTYTNSFGTCGFFSKKEKIPDDVQPKADIVISESTFIAMVKEGLSLHNRFLFYEDNYNSNYNSAFFVNA